MTKRFPLIWAVLLVTISSSLGWANAGSPPASVINWQKHETELVMNLSLAELLTPKQRQMIEGGFTTFSQLSFFAVDGQGRIDRDQEVFQIRCSVKYDAWEEEFDVVKMSSKPQTKLLRSFDTYAELCLQGWLSQTVMTDAALGPSSGLVAELSVIQTSIEEEKKIKEWLISQQSGVMQTLFSHMLGELSLHQKLTVKLTIPDIPETMGSGPLKPAKDKG